MASSQRANYSLASHQCSLIGFSRVNMSKTPGPRTPQKMAVKATAWWRGVWGRNILKFNLKIFQNCNPILTISVSLAPSELHPYKFAPLISESALNFATVKKLYNSLVFVGRITKSLMQVKFNVIIVSPLVRENFPNIGFTIYPQAK